MPHIHIGPVEFVTVALYTLIFSFLWRMLTSALANRPIGKAMAAVYS